MLILLVALFIVVCGVAVNVNGKLDSLLWVQKGCFEDFENKINEMNRELKQTTERIENLRLDRQVMIRQIEENRKTPSKLPEYIRKMAEIGIWLMRYELSERSLEIRMWVK